uniref:BLE2 protein n=2 Tax=Hordeum vulgare subsp. vulgare TaxID=112509 RepID=A0A8I6Y7F9_HORVV
MAGGGATASGVAEHRVEMPAPPAAGKAAAPDRRLVRFVRLVALVERAGHALGTLAFTWATVVLLGGYPTVLRDECVRNAYIGVIGDFWAATIVFFLEATRMCSSRSNRLDYHLFFSTRGAFKPLAWNELVVIVCFSDVFMYLLISTRHRQATDISLIPVVILATCQFLCPRLHVRNPLRRAVSLWSPMVAILFLGPSVPYACESCSQVFDYSPFTIRNSVQKWIVYLVLCVIVFLLTISRLRLPCIIKLADSAIGRKLAFWHKTIMNLCMFAAATMLVFTSGCLRIVMIIFQAYALVIVSFGNLQIPASLLRVGVAADRLSGLRSFSHIAHPHRNPDTTTNLVPSLIIFYVMVLGQGMLYIVACILQVFSFILRRSLIRGAGLRGERGMEHVDLYYSYAFEKHMEGDILSAKNMSIVTFAIESLKSDRPKTQLQGVQMLDSFLKKEPFRTMTISKLTSSSKTVTSLLNMVGWTGEGYRDIRTFAAKVLAELAVKLRVAPIPGAMQCIASLLHTVDQLKVNDHLLDIDSQEPKQDAPIQPAYRREHNYPPLKFWKRMVIYCLIPVEEPSKLIDEQDSSILNFWKYITKWCSVPEEKQPKDHDFLPVLGMLILERLGFDTENCMEISRAGLISVIAEFTSSRTDLLNINEADHMLLKGSSLKVLRRLASTKWRLGVKLRHEISEHPFLLGNLAEIFDDHESNKELRELAAEILRNLAMDGNTREEIGHFQDIISGLVHAFLSRDAPSLTDSDKSLQIIAGQALAMLTMESPSNCLAISTEPGYAFIKELTTMIHVDRYRYTAASLLRNMCAHARSMLSKADLKELSHILPEVLEGIMDAEGAKLEVLAGLGSQICNVIPKEFAQELECGQTKERFIKGLISSLNANMKPAANCPGVRRAIVELAVSMMECNPSYTICFDECRMMEALLLVEQRPSRAENYRYFSDDVGLMEHSIPLSALVARAKEMMGGNNLYWGP